MRYLEGFRRSLQKDAQGILRLLEKTNMPQDEIALRKRVYGFLLSLDEAIGNSVCVSIPERITSTNPVKMMDEMSEYIRLPFPEMCFVFDFDSDEETPKDDRMRVYPHRIVHAFECDGKNGRETFFHVAFKPKDEQNKQMLGDWVIAPLSPMFANEMISFATNPIFEFAETTGLTPKTEEERWGLIEDVAAEMVAVFDSLIFINSVDGAQITNIDDPEKQRRANSKRVKKGKAELLCYKTITLNGKRLDSDRGNGTHASPKAHMRRGHYRRLIKREGITWVRPHLVGREETGFVAQSYDVKPS